MQIFTPDEKNRVFKFDQSEAVYFKFSVDDPKAVYFKFSVDDINNCVEKCW